MNYDKAVVLVVGFITGFLLIAISFSIFSNCYESKLEADLKKYCIDAGIPYCNCSICLEDIDYRIED